MNGQAHTGYGSGQMGLDAVAKFQGIFHIENQGNTYLVFVQQTCKGFALGVALDGALGGGADIIGKDIREIIFSVYL